LGRPGATVELAEQPALGHPVLDPVEHGVGEEGGELLGRALVGRGDDGRLHPGARHLEIVEAEGGVDGEHLLVAEPADGPRLGGALPTAARITSQSRTRPGGRVGEVLGRGPHRGSLGCRLQGHDAGGQATAAVEEPARGRHGRGDREPPAQRVVGGLEPEKVSVHPRPGTLSAVSPARIDPVAGFGPGHRGRPDVS
jgi:hypothetical protein